MISVIHRDKHMIIYIPQAKLDPHIMLYTYSLGRAGTWDDDGAIARDDDGCNEEGHEHLSRMRLLPACLAFYLLGIYMNHAVILDYC